MSNERIATKAVWPMIIAGLMFFATSGLASPATAAEETEPAVKAEHRVAVIYFHRTKRCPTCKLISSYIEGAVKDGFRKELAGKRVTLHMIDYQSPKNKKFTKSYKISRPTMVIVDVHGHKVTEWKPMPKVWSLVSKKPEFLKYVQQGVRAYLDSEDKKTTQTSSTSQR